MVNETQLVENAGAKLNAIVQRIKNVESEKDELAADIKLLYRDAKAKGFDAATIRKIVSNSKKDPDTLREKQDLLDIYEKALGEFANTELGESAIRRVG